MSINLQSYVAVVLALQFAVFGWRINREISLDDAGRRTWLLISDYFILLSMLAVLLFCIIKPIVTGVFSSASKISLSVSFVIVVFYPLILAGHYRLFSKKGRSEYVEKGKDVPRVSDQEAFFLAVTIIAAIFAGFWTAN